MLLKRIYFAIKMGYRYRHTLANIYQSSPHRQLHNLSPTKLKQQGITVLVLDFDGVLAAHGEHQPSKELRPWLDECIDCFGVDHVFVLSNKPIPSRVAYFNHHHRGIQCITAVKKKPYPDGLKKITALTRQPSQQVMLVDDRLLTGVLAACLANVSITYITQPYVRLSKRPLSELFFMILRLLERRFFRLYS